MRDTEEKSVCFSGHRRVYEPAEILRAKVREALLGLIGEGVRRCYCGGATGFDLLCGEVVSELIRAGEPLRLVMAIPCPEQTKYYSAEDRLRHETLCNAASECVTVSPRYGRYCMMKRNQYMADRSEVLICYLRERTGGTASTRAYAEMKGKRIIDL